MSFNLRDHILNCSDIPTESVKVREWRGEDGKPVVLTLRGLTGAERDAFEDSWMLREPGSDPKRNMANLRARLIVLCVVDAEGKRVFSDLDVADLGKKSARALDRIYVVAERLSGFGKKDIEELAAANGGKAAA